MCHGIGTLERAEETFESSGTTPAIIAESLFNVAQGALARPKRNPTLSTRKYLLTGFFECACDGPNRTPASRVHLKLTCGLGPSQTSASAKAQEAKAEAIEEVLPFIHLSTMVFHRRTAQIARPSEMLASFLPFTNSWLPGLTAQSALLWDSVKICLIGGLRCHTQMKAMPA